MKTINLLTTLFIFTFCASDIHTQAKEKERSSPETLYNYAPTTISEEAPWSAPRSFAGKGLPGARYWS